MRVALLKSGFGAKGGLEKYAKRLANAFLERGHQLTVVTTQKMEGLPCAFPRMVPWPGFLRLQQYDRFALKYCKDHEIDLIFGMDRNRHQTHLRAGNGVHADYLESRIAAEGKFKYLMCQMNPLHKTILSLEKSGFENPKLKTLFTNSHFVKKQILNRYHVPAQKIVVAHNGVEWHEMESDFASWEEGRLAMFKKHNLSPHHFHFLFMGSGFLRKGLNPLLEAFARLKDKHIHLSVVGKDKDTDLYRARAFQLGLGGKVTFFGETTMPRSFYQMADCLVIPSFYDPFANVTVEALAMGLFIISSKTNGGHEVLTESTGALIDDLSSPEAFQKALERALDHSKTQGSAYRIRESVKHLDFSKQLGLILDMTLHG